MARGNTFYDVLTDAINDFAEHGFDSEDRLKRWVEALRRAAEQATASAHAMEQMMRDGLTAIYRRLVDRGGALKLHPTVGRFRLEQIKPQLRAELDRRILASANLIKLNRVEATERTLRRFQGWATSIPVGGGATTDKVETKTEVRKALAQLPFEARRVLIDQGHKLSAAINETVAVGGGAIALIWHSHWRQAGYNYRPDHKERDGEVYIIRGNWALGRGLIKPGPAGYYDGVTAVAQEPFCRCQAQFLYNLRDLPDDMLTVKGRAELERVKVA